MSLLLLLPLPSLLLLPLSLMLMLLLLLPLPSLLLLLSLLLMLMLMLLYWSVCVLFGEGGVARSLRFRLPPNTGLVSPPPNTCRAGAELPRLRWRGQRAPRWCGLRRGVPRDLHQDRAAKCVVTPYPLLQYPGGVSST